MPKNMNLKILNIDTNRMKLDMEILGKTDRQTDK